MHIAAVRIVVSHTVDHHTVDRKHAAAAISAPVAAASVVHKLSGQTASADVGALGAVKKY